MGKSKDIVVKKARIYNYTLTEREKVFCEIYCQYGVSGVDAIYEAGYKPKDKKTAYSMASENLRKPKILSYIKKLFMEYQLIDEDVMREHLYLIKQQHDLPSKVRAIDMYYKKRGFYSKESIEKREPTTVVLTKYSDLTDEELQERFTSLMEKYRKREGTTGIS